MHYDGFGGHLEPTPVEDALGAYRVLWSFGIDCHNPVEVSAQFEGPAIVRWLVFCGCRP